MFTALLTVKTLSKLATFGLLPGTLHLQCRSVISPIPLVCGSTSANADSTVESDGTRQRLKQCLI